jgi:type IV pilus assembly protein PilC
LPKASRCSAKKGKITARDIATFSRQIATMMQSGVPMVQSFEMIARGTNNPRLKAMLTISSANIEGGSSLSEAITKHPLLLRRVVPQPGAAGESAGVLDTVLDTIASYKENLEALKGKIKKALFYPAAVIAVAIIVSAILLIFVVPQFEDTFKSFRRRSAGVHPDDLGLSEFVVAYWWAMLLIAMALFGFAFTTAYKRSDRISHFMAG